jgi:hypothetical protein
VNPARGWGAWLRRAAPLVILVAAPGCVYFNGIYNAREAQRNAEKRARSGRESEASTWYATMAEKAETVLVRFPKSRWKTEALYLAGRGHALSNRCQAALPRLVEFLAIPQTGDEKRDRAGLALGTCLVRLERYSEALHDLDSLARTGDKDVASEASLWAARAAIALGDNERARRYLAGIEVGVAQWELAAASLQRGEHERAESLLVLRASRGDWREEVIARLHDLWAAGRHDAVERIVNRYEDSRAPAPAKVRLHLTAAQLQADARDPRLDSLARAHLRTAMRASTDTLVDREAAARLTALALRTVSAPADVDGVVQRSSRDARGHPLQLRLEDNALLVRILLGASDASGGSHFLAGEVARDSLDAPLVARELFRRTADVHPGTLVAPRALLAAAQLWPDSADAFHARIRRDYAESPYGVLLAGGDPGRVASYGQAEVQLRDSWAGAVRALTDSIRALRPPPAQASSQPPGEPGAP